jgi:hypothetical protein
MRSSCRSSSSSWDTRYRSSASWLFSQNCGVVPSALASRSAVDGVMPRRPLTISFSRTYETPIRSASSAWVMPSGLMNSSSSISPGGVGGRSDGTLTCAISVTPFSDSPRSRYLPRPARSTGSTPATDR